ncbi:YdcF family protein [Nostoc sp. CMAA1605]|uniref:YdcF family protein n=1 Tax=Nostoc sp. CMAA1605 TaxID=2055159 RepID=UPI001F353726|nr:YdcF family protein [Nostoc sp. CMAA1605]MCF4967975.1 YdcF family protein [Nostoc sp. CMAA1605]
MLFLVGFILAILLTIPVRLAITYCQVPQPQAILTLGGGADREEFTASFAHFDPDLKIWVSSGSPPKRAREIFHSAGIDKNRLYLDYQATDTVTNFTTLVDAFQQQQIQHLFLITSKFHMPRAKAIATVVLGSRGIAFTPVSVPSQPKESESILRIIRDVVRSILWIFTGYTGAEF